MKRKITEELEPANERIKNDPINSNDRRIHQTRKYKLITPLFGGGIVASENDPSKLIRETSVRGQLRFWWRAMCAEGSLHDIYKREAAIFGASAGEKEVPGTNEKKKFGCSAVAIRITVNKSEAAEPVFELDERERPDGRKRVVPRNGWKPLAYAAFPLQPPKEELQRSSNVKFPCVTPGIEFTLELSFPKEFEDDIEAALWAWETFGGVGGRTRRGFGALQLLEIDGQRQALPKSDELERRIKSRLPEIRNVPKGIPYLDKSCRFKIIFDRDAMNAWGNAIDKYRKFRQYRKDKNTGELSEYGISQWPEPAAIKYFALKGQRPSVEGFPRADFGLPIIFHFPQIRGLEDYTLNGDEFERLASPLIIRPIACANGAAAIALVLNAKRAHEKPLKLTSNDGFNKKVNAELTLEQAKVITTNGLDVLNGKSDVLEAFLEHFAKAGSWNEGQRGNIRR